MGGSYVRRRSLTGAAPTVPAEALFAAANRGAVAAKAFSTSRREPPRDVSWYAATVSRLAASTQNRAALRIFGDLNLQCVEWGGNHRTPSGESIGHRVATLGASPKGALKTRAFDERRRRLVHSRPKLVLRRVVRLHGTPVHRIVHHGRLRQEGGGGLGPHD